MVLVITVIILFTISFMPTYAKVDNIEKTEKERCIESHINDLLNGYVQPVNEDIDRNINISVGGVEKIDPLANIQLKNTSQKVEEKTELVKQKSNLDIILLNDDEREYLATIIIDNEYETKAVGPINSHEDIKNKTDCDVKLSYSAVYKVMEMPGGERVMVTKYIGTYVKKSDPQMTCSRIRFTSKAEGLVFNSSGKYIGSGVKTPDMTVVNPGIGVANTYLTNQQGYVEIPPGNNAGRMHYTLKRTVSSYTTTGYMAFDWGDYYT